jgi:hypothetical protein
MFGKLWASLQGKKTYFIGVFMVIGAVGSWLKGDANDAEASTAVFNAILFMTVRHGITNQGN